MKLEELVREIAEDSTSGAAQLTVKTANTFLKLLGHKPRLRSVKKLARLLAEARPSMPSIGNMAFRISRDVEKHVSEGEKVEAAIEVAVRSAVRDYQATLRKVVENASKILRRYSSVLVHSYSSTAAAAIELAEKVKVYVTESRPGYEGRSLAERLAEKGFDVTLIVDSAAAYVIDRGLVDAFVTGCDAILDDSSIVNKIGTKMIALAARDGSIPYHVLTDLWKAAVYGFSFEEHSSEEVYSGDSERVSALNPYFEAVPARLITSFITEEGVLKPGDLVKRIRKLWGEPAGQKLTTSKAPR